MEKKLKKVATKLSDKYRAAWERCFNLSQDMPKSAIPEYRRLEDAFANLIKELENNRQ